MSWLAVKGFMKAWWPFLLAAAVAIILLVVYLEGKSAGTSNADRARLKGNVKALEKKNKADAGAATSRVQDATRTVIEERELKEAIDEAKSQGRDPRAAYYECVRVQQRARKAGNPAPAC